MSDVLSTGSDPMAFTKDEVDAMRATKHLLLTKFKLTEDKISNIILAITTMNCECKPETAAERYTKWLKLIDDGLGIKNFDDVLDEVGFKGEKLIGSTYEAGLASMYYVCGRDKMDRAIIWIRPRPAIVRDEVYAVKTSIIHFVAIHADFLTLRGGTSYVLDTTTNAVDNKRKNERKLEEILNAMPIRPRVILILGASCMTRFSFCMIRFLLYVLFYVHGFYVRIILGTMKVVRKEFDAESMPTALGGKGGGVTTDEEHILWVKNRLENFPTLPDLSLPVSTSSGE